jgi:hypothetical protein
MLNEKKRLKFTVVFDPGEDWEKTDEIGLELKEIASARISSRRQEKHTFPKGFSIIPETYSTEDATGTVVSG